MMEGPFGAYSGEKHELAGDIDTAAVDSLKALDPKRPIREADMFCEFETGVILVESDFVGGVEALCDDATS